jgi:radical SAM superfamily enzyme YgiQ (UPF0313 family)
VKVLLLSLPGLEEGDGHLFPLGIGYLVSALEHSHTVEACHYNKMALAKKEIGTKLRFLKPDVIGLTCSTFNRGFVKDLIRIIKGIDCRITVVVGGVHASFCYDQMLSQCGADFVVVGEGELTIVELCNALENDTPLDSVPGIAYMQGDHVILNPARGVVSDLDDLPMPDYSYARPFIERSGMGFLITSRGCPVRCTFCSTSSFWGQKVRVHSVARVVDEMEMLISDFKVRRIFFHDDTFNLGITRVKEICAEIMRRGIKIEWGCSCRVNPVSEEMIAAMVEAGCRHICWGIESGSEKMLQKIGKNITLSQIRTAYELSKKFNRVMSTGAFTMVGNPGECEKTVKETVNFLNTIPMTDHPSTSILYILPGTLLYEDLKRQGLINDSDWYRYNSVPYYTVENSFWKLIKWTRMVHKSGRIIPFDQSRHFWSDSILNRPSESRILNIAKIVLKPNRLLLVAKNYLPPGKVRF